MKKPTYVEIDTGDAPGTFALLRKLAGMSGTTSRAEPAPAIHRKSPLSPGRQYTAHDKPGGRAAQRRLRQRQHNMEKKYYG